jgi:NO-binding membrane sensor protein with MHYT domain
MTEMASQYNLALVALSYVISVLGSFAALRLSRRVAETSGGARRKALFSAALAMGAVAIWSMHFIGMLAYDPGMPVRYDLGITLASLAVAVLVTGVGIALVGGGPDRWGRLLSAGVIMGLGVASMHYTGMAAMRMQATMTYDRTLFLVSIAIAVVASIAALWLVFHAASTWQIVGSALVMGLAVCGMHYTGMKAMIMRHDLSIPVPPVSEASPEIVAYAVFLVAVAVLSVAVLMGTDRQTAAIRRTA